MWKRKTKTERKIDTHTHDTERKRMSEKIFFYKIKLEYKVVLFILVGVPSYTCQHMKQLSILS